MPHKKLEIIWGGETEEDDDDDDDDVRPLKGIIVPLNALKRPACQ
jgi:hypothetical protein